MTTTGILHTTTYKSASRNLVFHLAFLIVSACFMQGEVSELESGMAEVRGLR